MSREEADAEETKKKSDDMRLTLAIQKSKEEVCSTDRGKCGQKTIISQQIITHKSHFFLMKKATNTLLL